MAPRNSEGGDVAHAEAEVLLVRRTEQEAMWHRARYLLWGMVDSGLECEVLFIVTRRNSEERQAMTETRPCEKRVLCCRAVRNLLY